MLYPLCVSAPHQSELNWHALFSFSSPLSPPSRTRLACPGFIYFLLSGCFLLRPCGSSSRGWRTEGNQSLSVFLFVCFSVFQVFVDVVFCAQVHCNRSTCRTKMRWCRMAAPSVGEEAQRVHVCYWLLVCGRVQSVPLAELEMPG